MDLMIIDPMWDEFVPLWKKIRDLRRSDILVAGGYGLFLKQRWLAAGAPPPVVVSLENWREVRPRVTKDLDLVIGLDLLANDETPKELCRILQDCGFTASATNPRWQFVKQLDDVRQVIVELHAPPPMEANPKLKVDRIRVKHSPSLGDEGVHGRRNEEAIGCEQYPFQFTLGELNIAVPNPVTWSIMKLSAMRDRWQRSEDASANERTREFSREQAVKHAQDVCRVVAMTTRDERDRAEEVVQNLRDKSKFVDAVEIQEGFFAADHAWGRTTVEDLWRPDDLHLIRETLRGWFGPDMSG